MRQLSAAAEPSRLGFKSRWGRHFRALVGLGCWRIKVVRAAWGILGRLAAVVLTGVVVSPGLSPAESSGSEKAAWWVRFQVYSNSIEASSSMDDVHRAAVACPVAPELYRVEDDSLVGLISVLTMGQGDESLTGVMGPSDDVHMLSYTGSWDIKIYIPDGRFRVVLLPDPFFWTPSVVAQEKVVKDDEKFRITGILNVVDREGNVTFPPKVSPETVIRFERVKAKGAERALGFSARVDLEVAGGKLVDRHLSLVVDSDGDGLQDQVITGGPYVAP